MVKDNPRSRDTFLQKIGRGDLSSLFDAWKPSQQRVVEDQKPKAQVADQRITLSMSSQERSAFVREIGVASKSSGDSVSMSRFVRNKALSSIDIQEWKESASQALFYMESVKAQSGEYRSRINTLELLLESDVDEEDEIHYEAEIVELQKKLSVLKSQRKNRNQRLTGRLTLHESETIKWRAERLSIPTSDLLRMLIFDWTPGGSADEHMSFDTRRRFYISVLEVAENGWGDAPELSHDCVECAKKNKVIRGLRRENMRLQERLYKK